MICCFILSSRAPCHRTHSCLSLQPAFSPQWRRNVRMEASTRISKSCQVVLEQVHSSPWLRLLSKITPVLLFLMIFGCLSLAGATSSDSSCSHWLTAVPMIEARTMLTRTETRRVPARRFMAVHLRTGSAMTWSGHICVGTEVSGRDLG